MNEVKFKANQTDLNALGDVLGEEIHEATAILDTNTATAGQVLKVETPGEAPVWGEAGGGDVVVVHITNQSDGTQLADMTGRVVQQLIADGKAVIAVTHGFTIGSHKTLYYSGYDNGNVHFCQFIMSATSTTRLIVAGYTLEADGYVVTHSANKNLNFDT